MAAARSRSKSRRYWLFKSEPESYSIDDLARDRRTHWNGIRNFQARNTLRDDVQVGDGVLFYHSNTKPLAVVGIARVVKAGYADHTAFEPGHGFDPKSRADDPTWYMVDIEFVARLDPPVTRDAMAAESALTDMVLLQRGSRLSVQPVRTAEWRKVLALADVETDW